MAILPARGGLLPRLPGRRRPSVRLAIASSIRLRSTSPGMTTCWSAAARQGSPLYSWASRRSTRTACARRGALPGRGHGCCDRAEWARGAPPISELVELVLDGGDVGGVDRHVARLVVAGG